LHSPRDTRLADLSYIPQEFLTLLSLYPAVQAPERKNSYSNIKMTLCDLAQPFAAPSWAYSKDIAARHMASEREYVFEDIEIVTGQHHPCRRAEPSSQASDNSAITNRSDCCRQALIAIVSP